MQTRTMAQRTLTYGSVAALSALLGAGSVWMGGATYFARRVLTPDPIRPDDTVIHEVDADSVTLSGSPDLVVPGRYGLWLDGGRGHARIGAVLDVDHRLERVRRALLAVDEGVLRPGPARFNGYYWGRDPHSDLGLVTEDVVVPTELGPMPAWVVPSEHGDGRRWAVLVHGRGAQRVETLRAIPALNAAGLTALVPSYRNDGEAPNAPDGRYNLGMSEWRDIEDGVQLALSRGAHEIVLVGWSMGGAIVLQFLDRSPLSKVVSRAILDGPVVDWGDVLTHHAELHHVPAPISHLGRALMGKEWARHLVGVSESLDVAKTDWVARAEELHHQILLIHSRDDEFVPVGPSEALAAARPDLVTYEPWSLARHCKEWNVDPHRWDEVVADFVR